MFIGADAETSWLPPEIARDARGYILTGGDVVKAGRWNESRDPYLVETSVPGVFACGDVRFSPVKRVASAVGEGSIAIAFVHQYLASVAIRISPRHERDPENRGDPGRRCRRLQPARQRGRRSHAGAAARAPQRSDRARDRRSSWPDRQAHRRRLHRRIPQRGRCGALRDRSADRHDRAQCGRAPDKRDRIPHRHPFGRCGRGGRRRPHGRRRQYRRAAGGHLRSPARSACPRTPIAR